MGLMKNIVLVLGLDARSRQTAQCCMQRIVTSKEFLVPRCTDRIFIKIVMSSLRVEQNLNITNDWLSPEETISLLGKTDDQEDAKERFGAMEVDNLAGALHEVADSLPYLGSSLDVIFCVEHLRVKALDPHSFVPITGALRRLVDWHNGQAIIVKLKPELTSFENHLVQFGHCQVVSSVNELNLDWPGWRGKVAVMDRIENRGHIFPAFWLECDDWDTLLQRKLYSRQQTGRHKTSMKSTDVQPSPRVVCGRTVEVLQEVDLRTFPFFLLDSLTLHLNAHRSDADVLVQYIQSLDQAGLLARLRLYPDSSMIPVCESMNLNTEAWKHRLVSDIHNLQEPPEEEVTEDAVFVYFLLLPNNHISGVVSPSAATVQVLLSPHEINRNIFCLLEDYAQVQRSGTGGSYGFCEELVLEEKDKFLIMLDLLKKNIGNAVSEYQGDVAKGGHDILQTATNVQAEIISAAFHGCKNLQEFMNCSSRQQLGCRIKWISASFLDPSKFPEKLTLQATETSRNALQSFPSMDSLTASSPLSAAVVEKKKNSIDFDLMDITQLFNQDGTMKTVPTCPVKLKGRGICRMNGQHDSKTLWPDSQVFRFHDVYYYNNEDDWGLEKRYTKVRDRGYFQDTRSSFVSPLKKNQQLKPANLVSPVRSLQRRTVSAQPLMSSKADKLKRVSPKKQSMQAIFKQPPSHSHSPRKLSQNPTPEFPSSFSSDSLGSADMTKLTPGIAGRTCHRLSRSQSVDQTTPLLAGNSIADPRKRSSTVTTNALKGSHKRDKTVGALAFPLTEDLPCLVRRSPRRSLGSSRAGASTSANLSQTQKIAGTKRSSLELTQANSSTTSTQASAKMKRSDRHKLKLQRIIGHVLKEKGIEDRDKIYAACSRNLFNVSMVLLKTLTTSQNLTEEMKTVVYGQVTQIINLEKRRTGMAV